MSTKEIFENMKRYYEADGGLNYCLYVFGHHLAKREGYKSFDGIEAIHFYLVTKYHWLPSQVRAMSMEDLRFVLSEEMSSWNLPEEARV